jgi:hypothetical protein
MLYWGHFGLGVYRGRKMERVGTRFEQLTLAKQEPAISWVVLYDYLLRHESGHIEGADCRCGRPCLDWKQEGGVPRNVPMRGGLSGRIIKERKTEQSLKFEGRDREGNITPSRYNA